MSRGPTVPVAVAAVACCLSAAPLAGAVAATINACVSKSTGQLRVLKAGGTCTGTERPLSWNSAGVQGPPGPQGPQGSAGPQGPQGPPGLSGFHTVTQQTGVVSAGAVVALDVSCASGETAISGGYIVPYTVTVLESHPNANNPGVWTAAAAFPSVSGVLTVYVQCAQVTTAAAAGSAKVAGATRVTRLPSVARPAGR